DESAIESRRRGWESAKHPRHNCAALSRSLCWSTGEMEGWRAIGTVLVGRSSGCTQIGAVVACAVRTIFFTDSTLSRSRFVLPHVLHGPDVVPKLFALLFLATVLMPMQRDCVPMALGPATRHVAD